MELRPPPAVSVIIPAFNREHLILEAIASAVGEAGPAGGEVIVVDDGSSDGTWERIKGTDSGVRAIRLDRNGGQAAARNAGLDVADGEFVKFLDSDDVLVPGHLRLELEAARETRADIVVSGWASESEAGECTEFSPPVFHSIIDDVLAGRAVPTSAALYRRERAARWDPAIRKLADWDFFVQSALGSARIVTISGVAYRLRDHAGPRVSRTSMLVNALSHHAILEKIESRIAGEGELNDARRRRLAQYYYKELRVLSVQDPPRAASAIDHIFALDPSFIPRDEERQRWMRVAVRVFGLRRAVAIYGWLKRRRDGLSAEVTDPA